MSTEAATTFLKIVVQCCALALLSVGGAFALVEATGWQVVLDAGAVSPYFICFDGLVLVAMQRGWNPEATPRAALTLILLAGALGGAMIVAWS